MEDLLNEHGPNNHIDRTARIEGDPAKRPHPEGSTFDIDKMTVDERCPECKLCYIDPKPDDMLLYLHSFRYKVGSLCVFNIAKCWISFTFRSVVCDVHVFS